MILDEIKKGMPVTDDQLNILAMMVRDKTHRITVRVVHDTGALCDAPVQYARRFLPAKGTATVFLQDVEEVPKV